MKLIKHLCTHNKRLVAYKMLTLYLYHTPLVHKHTVRSKLLHLRCTISRQCSLLKATFPHQPFQLSCFIISFDSKVDIIFLTADFAVLPPLRAIRSVWTDVWTKTTVLWIRVKNNEQLVICIYRRIRRCTGQILMTTADGVSPNDRADLYCCAVQLHNTFQNVAFPLSQPQAETFQECSHSHLPV